MINYRSIAAMSADVRSWLHVLPSNFDLIVGIPRSGLLVANILALHMNRQLTDVDGLIDGRTLGAGYRYEEPRAARRKTCRRVFVVDDTINSGREMERVRAKIVTANLQDEVFFGALYTTPGSERLVDYSYRALPQPRVFEWNIFHHSILSSACVDIDGVLCRDPTPDENDDGDRYKAFIEQVGVSLQPTQKIGYLVTCRLEKYRSQTEDWLHRWDISYDHLIMMDYPDKEVRVREGRHAIFKADAYNRTDALLFIESSPSQASEIARRAGKPVLCVETGNMIYPGKRDETAARCKRFARLCRRDPSKALVRAAKRASRVFRNGVQ